MTYWENELLIRRATYNPPDGPEDITRYCAGCDCTLLDDESDTCKECEAVIARGEK